MLRLYIWGYLNQLRSSRQLERACQRDLEAIWLMRRMTPDYRTIAAFRHDNPEAIIRTGAAFISRSEEHTSELQSLMRISYAVFCLKKKTTQTNHTKTKRETDIT